MRSLNCVPLRIVYRTPSITPESPIFADLVATIVNAPRPPRGLGTLTTFTSWTLFALFRPEDGLARFTLDEGDRLDDDRFPFILVLTANIFFWFEIVA